MEKPSNILTTTDEVSSFIEGFTQCYMETGNEYFYIPHWFLKHGVNKYEILSFEKLPKEIKDYIQKQRHEKK